MLRLRNLFIALSAGACALTLGSSAHAQLLFQDQGATKLTQGCSGNGCWTNYNRVTDFDGDGDLDLVAVNCGGFFGTTPQPLLVWKNDGAGNFTDASAQLGSIVAPVRQVAFGDVDGDGDLDLYVPGAGGNTADRLLIQTSSGVYEDQASTRLPAGLKSDAGFARMGDLNGDGALDLVVGNAYSNNQSNPAILYFNDGTGVFSAATTTYPQTKGGNNPDDVDLADVDRDFDLDILVNTHDGEDSLWINDGSGNFTEGTPPDISTDALHYGPVFCDVDGDGDLDVFVDNAAPDGSYEEALGINDGSGHFTDATNQVSGNSGSDDNLMACIDFDDDGDFDFVVGALSTNERVFENDGTGHFTFVAGAEDGPTDSTLWMEFGDLNGDGRLDLFTGQGESGSFVDRVYFGTAARAIDGTPPRLIAVQTSPISATNDNPVRFAVSDNATTDEGPRIKNVYVAKEELQFPAHFIGGDLYYAVLPPIPASSTFQFCATDWNDNTACTEFTEVPGGGEGGGGPGGAGQGGSGPAGGSSSVGGQGEGASATGGSGGGTGDTGEGCDCSVPTDRSERTGALALLGLALGLRALRRKNSK